MIIVGRLRVHKYKQPTMLLAEMIIFLTISAEMDDTYLENLEQIMAAIKIKWLILIGDRNFLNAPCRYGNGDSRTVKHQGDRYLLFDVKI